MKEERLKYDLVVIGGGLAGVCGALAARRHGLKTALIQDRPVLGGNASSEVRVNISGAAGKNPGGRETGIICELFLAERKINSAPYSNSFINSNLDLVLYDAVKSSGIDLFLNTSARRVRVEERRIISVACCQLGSEKELLFKGDLFLDASGDGTVAAAAGARFRFGREGRAEFGEIFAPPRPDRGVMGSSLLFLARDAGRPVPYHPPAWAARYRPGDPALKTRAHYHGYHSARPVLGGFWWIEIGYPWDTVGENETIREKLLAHLLGVWDHLKNGGEHGFGNFVLEWVGMLPGKRESRRFEGDYLLRESDLLERRYFPDAIGYGGWWIDQHTPGGILARREPPIVRVVENQRRDQAEVSPYQIPFRSLYSRDIRNLLLAGRNISVTHVALSSTRVMGTCGLLGQASGTAAWLCRKYRLEPREIHPARIKELQQVLLRDGVFIPGVVNEEKGDLLRGARARASSQAPLGLPTSEGEWELDRPRGQVLPLAGRVDRLRLPLRTKVPARLEFRLERLSDFWDRSGGGLVCEVKDLSVSPRDRCLSVVLNRELEPGFYRFSLGPAAGVFLKKASAALPALYAVERPGSAWRPCPFFQVDFQLAPDIYPFGPGNTVSGVNRPEKWTNLWISDPAAGFPQWLEWELARPVLIGHLQFFFEAALDLEYKQCPPFFVPAGIPSRYRVSILEGSRWKRVVEVKGNAEYLRRHDFSPRPARKVRLEILEVNGGRSAVVTEVRGYRRPPV